MPAVHPIRLCFIAPKAYPLFNPQVEGVFGGAEVDLYFLATELAHDADFQISFLTADYGQADVEQHENVTVIKTVDFRKNPLDGACRIWRALRNVDAHGYMIKTISPGMFLVAEFCRRNRKLFFYRTSNTNSCDGTYLREHPLMGRFYKRALRNAVCVFVQNDTDREGLERTAGVASMVIPNGRRLAELQDSPRDVILWVGRSAKIKGPERFVDLANGVPEERFVMICQRATGDLDYDRLRDKARAAQNLEFIERVPFHEADAYYRRAKVFVNTSDAEGFPNTFIQACERAVPILSLNVDPDDFLTRHNCGVDCHGDMGRLRDGLRFLTAGQKYVEIGQNARRYVEQRHDIHVIARAYKDIFRESVHARFQA
jgi:glycosyltransferase involved in cell wall biosynthesis